MNLKNYSVQESAERIYNSLLGRNPDDAECYLGRKSLNESMARIAQLMENSLGTTGYLPTILQKNSQRYGAIYTWTGTVEYQGMTASWTQITGAFQNSGKHSALGVRSEPNNARILINDYGIYFVSWQMSYIGSPDINYKVEPYCWVGMPQAAAESTPSASGSVITMSGCGFAEASGTAVNVALYMSTSNTAWFVPRSLQLNVIKVGILP